MLPASLAALIAQAEHIEIIADPHRSPANPSTFQADVDFPPILDSDDIAYFFGNRDLDGLEWALTNVFSRSGRHHRTELPEQIVARGGGTTYTAAYKLEHDAEQYEHLAEGYGNATYREMAQALRQVRSRIPSLDQLERTKGLYAFKEEDSALIGSFYNRAVHVTNTKLRDDQGNSLPLLNPDLNTKDLEDKWIGKGNDHPGIIVVDNLLTGKALETIQALLLESTVWYQTKLPLRFGGYVGAYLDDGLHDRILLELSLQLHDLLPRIFQGNALRYLWAYKYDSDYSGIHLHADQAVVNVNIWLTPDEANLDPMSGGLVVFTAKPPDDWDFASYNTHTDRVREELLAPTGFVNATIPYKTNRAVIFDSALFHQTDEFRFRKGYKNRRINLTLLYGTMEKASISNHDEL